MVNEKRLKIMVDLERYNNNRRDKNDSRYYRSDFMTVILIRRFFLITLAYVMIVGLVAVSQYETIIEQINNINIRQLIALLIISYIALVGIYLAVTYISSQSRFTRIKKHEKQYEHDLKRLEKVYDREERKR